MAARHHHTRGDDPSLDAPVRSFTEDPQNGAESSVAMPAGRDHRRFSVYEPLAAFDLVEELDFLTARAIEPVPFYAPQFLVPAMPRLDERQIRLLVARDEDDRRSRLRLLMPFSVEATGVIGGPSCVRAWTHPFGPRGTVQIDHDNPGGTICDLFDALRSAELGLPPLFVVPDLRLDGSVARALLDEAKARQLPFRLVDTRYRACLDATRSSRAFLEQALSSRRRHELARQRRRMAANGHVHFEIARDQGEVREASEEFLALEASGWKGRARSALLNDRYRAAFAREALDALSVRDRVRLFTLKLDGRAVASAVVLVAQGQAVLWKMAYDEAHATHSPGFQLLAELSLALLDDTDVAFVDSCAVPDHSLVNRLWRERIEIGTLVLGLDPGGERMVRRATAALGRQRALRQAGWRARSFLKGLRNRR